MNFTPGPWRREARFVMALKGKSVCECPRGGILHGKVDSANANLIAEAPEMYEALKALIALPESHCADMDCSTPDSEGCVWQRARAALAKADGSPA